MREMKDSGVISIGLIPVSWSIRKFKTLAKLCNGREVNVDEGCVPVYGSGGIFKWTNIPLHSGESLLMGRKGTIDNPMLVKGEFWTVDTMFYTSEFYDIKGKFLYYCCKGTINYGYYKSGSVLPSMTQMEINNVFLPYTTSLEQDKIVNVLDKKCAQVDALIANQQTQIEKLKAYKQSLITEVVTKGLDPDVPMKDSGVEWIGKIPEHWEIQKLKTRTNMLTPMRDKPADLSGPIPWIRIEDYSGKYISSSKEHLGVSADTVKAMNLKIYPIGTVLCTSSCDLGKCAIVEKELVSNQRFIGIIPTHRLSSEFLYYLMLSNAERLNTLSTGSIQANLSRVEFEQLLVQFPPLNEQLEITQHLDKKCTMVDYLIDITQTKIKKLEQYKKSLIYEYVTGKKEI